MNKYKNKKVEIDGIVFDSKAEAKYYQHLKENRVDFELQPKFLLQEGFKKNGKTHRKIEYIADFRIGNTVIDIKGMETTDFKIKAKLFEFKFKDLKLKLLKECPRKYEQHGIAGFIESAKLNKLRKAN